MPTRRPLSLTKSDLNAIRRTVDQSVAVAVPKAMHAEFMKLGLATEEDDDQLEAQKDFAFVRKWRRGSEAAEGLVGKQTIKYGIALIAFILAAGLGAVAQRLAH